MAKRLMTQSRQGSGGQESNVRMKRWWGGGGRDDIKSDVRTVEPLVLMGQPGIYSPKH